MRPLSPLLAPLAPLAHRLHRTAAMFQTEILPIDAGAAGSLPPHPGPAASEAELDGYLDAGCAAVTWHTRSPDYARLARAAAELRETAVPVAFPTETVYGLGADATRADATAAIFAAKNRPADNPLIVHVHSLNQARAFLRPSTPSPSSSSSPTPDPIPDIYKPLIRRFWPGPLTIVLPIPPETPFAEDCDGAADGAPRPIARAATAGLRTVGVRMPATPLSRLLLALADVPVAAPSANASTRPSPTRAGHVRDDLDGRIRLIVDGGPCRVGVESTIVDAVSAPPGSPPALLRPGGVSLEQIRAVPGWENTVIAYENRAEMAGPPPPDASSSSPSSFAPRAPGMKYKHYAPRARVLVDDSVAPPPLHSLRPGKAVGVVRTANWPAALGIAGAEPVPHGEPAAAAADEDGDAAPSIRRFRITGGPDLHEVALGPDPAALAHSLFWAFREMDHLGVDVIVVEGLSETGSGVTAAVMNRLRKAAEVLVPE